MTTTTTSHPSLKEHTYTRPLTFSELITITNALAQAVYRLHEEMFTTMGGYTNPESWNQLRSAAQALAGVTDHVVNDDRYSDDQQEETATAPA